MNKVTHKKGIHFGLPFKLPKKATFPIDFEFEFTEDSKYVLGNENQGDWNKMFGIKSGIFSQLKDGIMLVWRYDDKTDKRYVTLYVHGGKDAVKGYADSIKNDGYAVGSGNAYVSNHEFECFVNQKVKGKIFLNPRNEVVLQLTRYSVVPIASDFITLGRISTYTSGWRILSWFGGQETANCSFNLQIK